MTDCIFEPSSDNSSATVCRHCGQEKFMHGQPMFRKFTLMDERPSAPASDRTIMTRPVHDVVKLAEQSWEGCDGCTDAEEAIYKNGYVRGYNAAASGLPKEISKEEIEKAVWEHFSDEYGDMWAERIAFRLGAKWMQEKLLNNEDIQKNGDGSGQTI